MVAIWPHPATPSPTAAATAAAPIDFTHRDFVLFMLLFI
jgi:hypothetical protein